MRIARGILAVYDQNWGAIQTKGGQIRSEGNENGGRGMRKVILLPLLNIKSRREYVARRLGTADEVVVLSFLCSLRALPAPPQPSQRRFLHQQRTKIAA